MIIEHIHQFDSLTIGWNRFFSQALLLRFVVDVLRISGLVIDLLKFVEVFRVNTV